MSARPNTNRPSVRDLFLEALDKPSPAERDAYLVAACGSDVALRAKIEALLKSHQADSFLDLPAADVPQTKVLPEAAPTERPGTMISRYKLLEQIGEGGMGIVYMAEQVEPVRRRVALKVVKLGMDTRQVIARFEAERQALAMMDHPNIAKVLDAGATETGRPYFVMELVRGVPITRFCDENRLSTQERLDLFNQVCRAIQHAHQKGIIHRDIKPSNILVTVNDGIPVPKVIDFGVAKATTHQRLTDKTLFTAFEQFIGTPAYMSPEQADMSSLDIDTRSDIYALGVLLYELLTGHTPFDAKALASAGLDALRRTIREQEPVRPSTRLSVLDAEDLTTTAQYRRSDAPKLIHLLRGDLDWIVMKALEKDRTRRYETAHALAEDINRYLCHQPVFAAPPGLGYRASKFWRRHRSRITTAAVVTTLLCGLVTTVWMYHRSVQGQRVRWAKEAALPELVKLVEQGDYSNAFALAQQARELIPQDPVLAELWPRICQDYSITTQPAGAAVFYRDYSTTDAPWHLLGQSPLEHLTLPQGPYRWKIEKEGFATHECVVDHSFEVRLQEAGPLGEMVWVSPFAVDLPAESDAQRTRVEASAFLMDRYEVTNEKYQAFVDAGGYDDPAFWQGLEFIKDGRPLPLSEAQKHFRDQTDRPGPATWANGTYPMGQGHHPVSGVSWFEAAAYARFAGKSLPTVHQWEAAACLPEALVIVPFSNFGMHGTAPVDRDPGMGHTGLYGMAGNVKEWCLNATDEAAQPRYILGGGWGEPTYIFTERDSRSPWNRSPQNGFRCVRLPAGGESLAGPLVQPIAPRPWRDVSGLVPFSDEEFRMLKASYAYDRIPLAPVVESRAEDSPLWREETITFAAAYDRDRVMVHLFLPKTAKPPYQTVIYFPGVNAILDSSFHGLPYSELTHSILRSGRALLFPIYYGTYERPAARGRVWTMDSLVQTPLAYRDWTIRMAKDLSRSVDYLETRKDIDSRHIAYCGVSMGALLGPIMLAVEDRLNTGILVLGGIPPVEVPRSFDFALYAQRVQVPVLMVNGREDALARYQECQLPLYTLLHQSNELSEHKTYDGGHGAFGLFYTQIRADVLAWLDRYLGPVE